MTNNEILKKYKIRGDRTEDEVLQHWESFKKKFPDTKTTFKEWLVSYGKVYFLKEISQKWVDKVTSEDDGITVIGKDMFEAQKIPPTNT